MSEQVTSQPSQLYRHYDSNGNLLYVGISISTIQRLSQHKDFSHWFEKISKVTIEHHKSREEAIAAEIKAIKEEKPEYNIKHKQKLEKEAESYSRSVNKHYDRSSAYLISDIVQFRPLYTVTQAAEKLGFSPRKVRDEIRDGKLSAIVRSERMATKKDRSKYLFTDYYISGWQMMDYIESISRKGSIQ